MFIAIIQCIKLQDARQLAIFLRLASGESSPSFLSSFFTEDFGGTIFAFFLTTTPLRVFLISFFTVTEGLAFVSAADDEVVLEVVAVFAAEVLAATALYIEVDCEKKGNCQQDEPTL